MGRLFWIILFGPNKISEVLMRRRRDQVGGDVITEGGGWSDARKEPQAMEYRQPLETEKGKEMNSPLKPSGGTQSC